MCPIVARLAIVRSRFCVKAHKRCVRRTDGLLCDARWPGRRASSLIAKERSVRYNECVKAQKVTPAECAKLATQATRPGGK